jgi:transcriptional regulator with XRE-family HTH domain
MSQAPIENPGQLLRDWRRRRNVSQLDLAHRAGVSARHVSFIETGRSRPTSSMILRLCDQLAVPLREQNRVLLAGGHAPVHPVHQLADPPMAQANAAIEAIWALTDGLPARLLEPPINVIRLSLDPEGMAPRIVNLEQWRELLVARLRHEHDLGRDPRVAELIEEFAVTPAPEVGVAPTELVVPLRLRVGDTELSLLSTTTVFGTPREVTLSELAIEAFYPGDEATRAALTGARALG